MSDQIRLQKYLAQCGIASRRKAEVFIREGHITVDGIVITDMGAKIDPQRQQVLFDGRLVTAEKTKVYVLLNKPRGFVTTLSDPQGRPVVTSLVKIKDTRLFPVGRLDLDTEGALILTNDGDFAQKVQHPSYEVTKTYEAVVAGRPDMQDIQSLERGIVLEGRTTAPASVRILQSAKRTTHIQITIHEGRKRQVKMMFRAIQHPVLQLKRIAYGNLSLGNLRQGSYRTLTPKDLKKIFKNIPLQKEK
ncbi:MAG: pseudouridine synthase [Desulfopila sp.]|nr:pseudouridine synthase [Desulfopila sp.]